MADSVAWTMMRRGWRVLNRSGEELGRVGEVMGDREAEIFNGLLARAESSREASTFPPSRSQRSKRAK